MEITRKIGEYVARVGAEDFSPRAVYTAKAGIIDCLGCMLAGLKEPLVDILCQFIGTPGGALGATVVGRGFRTSAAEAAFLNGAAGHALDYDDITTPIKGHPSVVLLPSALALGEEQGATGQEVLLAYIVGFEVACSVAAGMSPGYFDDLGWHPTGPLGILGAAAAAARLLKLDARQSAMAISLEASQASGLRQNFGTMTKPFHAGTASRAGIIAAKLVEAGFTASTDGIEGRFGFMRAFSGGQGYDAGKVLEALGTVSHLETNGIDIKKYPCCGSTLPALDALFLLLKGQEVDPHEVEEVEVRVDFDPPRSLIHSRPKTTLEGKFSMQYCVAAALLDKAINLRSFTDEQVMRPEAQELFSRINMVRNPGYEGQPSWVEGYTGIRIRLKDGRAMERGLHRVTEGALRGTTMEDVRAKFRDCACQVLPEGGIDHLLDILERMEELDNVGRLTDLVRA